LLERAEKRGGVPRAVAVQLVSQVLSGLHAAHELSDDSGPLGVVHRDVSPHNILVTYEGVAKLLDFGIAKATRQASQHTQHGEIKGKFSYMAPEQILGGTLDRRVDVFAAGIVLYLLTTGQHPFRRHNTAATIHAITTDEPVTSPSALVEDYPAELESVLLKALEKDAEKRFGSAEEMRNALEQALPDAFGDVGRSELKTFMDQTVGDRRVARREAVRRAQLAADARDVDTGTRKALQTSAQSASSLRAISISQPAPGDVPELVGPNDVAAAEQAPQKAKRASRGPYLAAIAGIALAAAATIPRLFAPAPATTRAATSGVEAGTLVPSALTSAASPAPAPLVPEPAVAEPAPAAAASAASAPGEPKPKLLPPRALAKAKTKTASGSPAPRSNHDDLMAPDYAR
jgi:serine/threonine protein kinase